MPPRLAATRSRLGDILIYDRGAPATPGEGFDAATKPIALHLDTKRTSSTGKPNFSIQQRWLPTEAGADGGVQLSEWVWSNGPGGAGTTIETPRSYQDGACQHGENVWLRRVGVAQPAGKITELDLPSGTSALTGGNFTRGQMFGATSDLYITTAARYILKVPGGTGLTALSEQDCGVGAGVVGIAVFNGAGSSRLYVGDTGHGIWEYDGASWTSGEAGTAANWLEVVYWVLGDQLATGGASGSAGNAGHRLIAVNSTGTGFRHVAGDPQVDANYSALTTVGVGGTVFPIQRTVSSNRVVWFGTTIGVLGVDSLGYSPNETKAVELFGGVNTGQVIAYWNGMIFFATEQGLMAFSPDGSRVDIPQFVQFGARSGQTPIYGRPRALAPSEDGLYVGYFNSETVTSYVGVLLMDGGNLRWSMAEAVIDDEHVTYLQQVSGSDGNPRLYIGTVDTGGGLHLYAQSLPKSGDPETDFANGGPFQAATSWNVTLSRTNGQRAIRKTERRFMLEADQLGDDFPSNSVEFQVSNDGGAFTTQGTAQGSNVDLNRWSAQPAVDTAQATSFQVKLVVANTPDAPVIIRTASVLYSSHPELSRVVTVPVIIGEGFDSDPRETLQRLEETQRAGPLVMDDYFGRRIEGTVSIDNETVVMEAERNGFTVHADVTILYTRQVTITDGGDLTDSGYLVS